MKYPLLYGERHTEGGLLLPAALKLDLFGITKYNGIELKKIAVFDGKMDRCHKHIAEGGLLSMLLRKIGLK